LSGSCGVIRSPPIAHTTQNMVIKAPMMKPGRRMTSR
jgi:hypothetical protein